MPATWRPIPYEVWSATCDTLHAHTQVLGKLAAALAPPEPQLQHAALRLSGRGWETLPLPAPDGSGAFLVALDLQNHHAVAEHSDGRSHHVPLGPNRPVGTVTKEVLAAVTDLVGPVPFDPTPQEVPWTTGLDEDEIHFTYNPNQVTEYFAAATQAALVLAAVRAPYRGRSTPVNAWWGSFDLAVSLFSGKGVDPPSGDFITRNSANAQQIEFGWWPGDARYPHAAFFAFAVPAPKGLAKVLRSCRRRERAGRKVWASSSSTGTMSATRRTPSTPLSTSGLPPSGMRAPCADGIRSSRPAPKGYRHRFSEPRAIGHTVAVAVPCGRSAGHLQMSRERRPLIRHTVTPVR